MSLRLLATESANVLFFIVLQELEYGKDRLWVGNEGPAGAEPTAAAGGNPQTRAVVHGSLGLEPNPSHAPLPGEDGAE